MKLVINSRYNYPQRTGITFTDKTRTQQQFAQETDINEIMSRVIATGDESALTPDQRAEFYDCTAFNDYQSSIDFVNGVHDDFYTLPASVRREFGDDPSAYVDFVVNPDNFDRCVELGILQGSVEPKPTKSASETEQPPAGPSETKNPESDA